MTDDESSEENPHINDGYSFDTSFEINLDTHNSYKINLMWLDQNINNSENRAHQIGIKSLNKFNTFFHTQIKESISELKNFEFVKTYILINGSISEEFFSLFEKVLDEIKICPVIIVLILIYI